MFDGLIDFIDRNRLDKLTDLIGLLVAIIGFGVTLWKVQRSKSAAEDAASAARDAKEALRRFDTISEVTAVITVMEEIKRLHREKVWHLLPDRYATLRKSLIMLRRQNPDLSEENLKILQRAITNLADFEDVMERALSDEKSDPDYVRINSFISRDIDGLSEILIDMREKAQ